MGDLRAMEERTFGGVDPASEGYFYALANGSVADVLGREEKKLNLWKIFLPYIQELAKHPEVRALERPFKAVEHEELHGDPGEYYESVNRTSGDNLNLSVYGESSLSRILHHFRSPAAFGVISAFRGELAEAENYRRAAELSRSLQGAGYGFIEMEGGFTENPGAETELDVIEFSYFVPGILRTGETERNDRLRKVLLEAGKAYGQDAILYRPFREKEVLMIECVSGAETPLGPGLSFAAIGSFWSRLHRGTASARRKFKIENAEND
jgi:hypothetical protein